MKFIDVFDIMNYASINFRDIFEWIRTNLLFLIYMLIVIVFFTLIYIILFNVSRLH